MRRAMLAAAALAMAAACGEAPGPEAQPAPAASSVWRLAPADSRISFVSVKNTVAAEAHHFKELSGEVGADGAFRLEIPLASVETNVEIRNERMRDMLFEIAQFPAATLTGQIDLAQFESLAVGQRTSLSAPAQLDLHGVQASLELPLFVTRIAENRVAVETSQPVMVNAADFGLEAGVERLRAAVQIASITPAAPVTASLVFER